MLFRCSALLGLFLSGPVFAQSNAVSIPPLLEGPTYQLDLSPSTHSFFTGVETATYGINGSYLGPTLILNAGEAIQMHVRNGIGETTTMHWHGMHVAPDDDGGPHTTIAANATWSPAFTVLDRATTFWYHPHLHEHTNEQVYRGLAGLIIVRDNEEAALVLPRQYGVDDIPLILQDRTFGPDGQLVFDTQGAGAGGGTMVINGTVDPFVAVGAQIVRFRVLNGSGARVYNLGLSDGRTFHQIGSDGGLLAEPAPLTRLRLAPGERAELLIDFVEDLGKNVRLMSYASELRRGEPGGAGGGGMGGMGGSPSGPLDGMDFDLVEMRVGEPTADAVMSIPASLVSVSRISESESDRTRTFRLDGGMMTPFTIDGQPFDINVINQTVTLGDTEIWSITNLTPVAHPFHIHDVQFYILDRGGVPPSPSEQGRKDVVLIEPMQTVRFISTFEDFADPVVPFMYHCHLLGHEDDGMMGQFLVVDPMATGVTAPHEQPAGTTALSAYPNPAGGRVSIKYEVFASGPVQVDVFDLLGRHVRSLVNQSHSQGQYTVDWSSGRQSPGVYLIRVLTSSGQSNTLVTRGR